MHFIGVQSKKKYYDTNIWHGDDYELLDWYTEIKKGVSLVNNAYKGVWRYKNFLPKIDDNNIVSVQEGSTPLINLTFGSIKLKVKLEHLFLTGSYKDRGSTVLISFAKQHGIKQVIHDSSGNAGASMAAYCAMAGITCNIFVPENTSPGKIVQAKASGANVMLVKGSRNDTAKAAFKAAQNSFYASHCYHPVFFEGTKTFLFEVFEQLNFRMPDALVLPAGNGTLLLGCYIAVKQLIEAGLTDKIPKIIAVQASNCNALYQFLNQTSGLFKPTIAEGIAIQHPVRLRQMAQAVTETNGVVVCVDEDEIIETLKKLARMGFMVEPTSASVIAGAEKYVKNNYQTGEIVTLFSGHGLKATDKWIKLMEQ